MRELRLKIQKFGKGRIIYLHWDMFFIQNNAVLIIIDIGGVLQEEVFPIQFDRDYSVVFPGRIVCIAGIAFGLPAELAFRISALRSTQSCCDRFRILFRF